MTVNKNNWFAMYYNWVYGLYPNDVCSFFWGSLLAILMSPLMLPGKAIAITANNGRNDYNYGEQSFGGLLIWGTLVATTIVGNVVFSTFGYEFTYILSIVVGGFGIGILTFMLIGAVIWLIIKLLGFTRNMPESFIDNTIDLIAAVRGKYCTRITWK